MIRPHPDAEARLKSLSDQVRRELQMLSFATKSWVMPVQEDGTVLPNVVIIGAGQSGLSAGLELKRRGVEGVVLLDASPRGYEGVWETYARNYEIRSPKDITGLEGGLPSLTIEAFMIAAYGQDGWDDSVRVPRKAWMDYLRFFRACADLDIRNDTRVTGIDFDAQGVTLSLEGGASMRARQVVLATGMDGGGRWQTPAHIRDALPDTVWNHSADVFDETKLAGKRVGILGAGAAAFDMAVTALDAGARTVDMFLRRRELPMRDVIRELETGGYLVHAPRVPDMLKWEIAKYMSGLSQAPAEHHFHKACACENFNIHLASPWEEVQWTGAEIAVRTPRADWQFDHVFTATGVTIDMTQRPELAQLQAKAALWKHRFQPPAGEETSPRLNAPYLDDRFRFTERVPGTAPGIDRVFAFNALAGMSMGGLATVSIGAFRFGTPKLADAVTERLFDEQVEGIVPFLETFDQPGVTIPDNMAAKLAKEAEAIAEWERQDA